MFLIFYYVSLLFLFMLSSALESLTAFINTFLLNIFYLKQLALIIFKSQL